MALNFNLLRREGPGNVYEGLVQGQEQARVNALAQQKMAQEQEMNALRRQESQLGMENTRALMAGREEDRAKARRVEKTAAYRDRLIRASSPDAVRQIIQAQYADPDLAPVISQTGTLDQALAEVPDDPTQFQTYRQQEAMGMSAWMNSQMPKAVGGAIFLPSEGKFLTPPPQPKESTPPPMVAEYQFAQTPQGGGFRGSYQDFVIAREAAKRPPPQPVQPVAPTVAQIQDPTNPSQMITIDARRYQGGGVGSPGVIGTSGRTAPVAAAEQKRTEGAQQAQDILDTLRTAYDDLDRMRAVPSEQRNVLSNAVSYVAGTSVGQVAGRVAGTKEQTQRDIIQSARNQMLNAIKNATGMSAQQLNSNVEFRSWLEALTDPTRSIEANRTILDNMEKFVASGGKYSAKKGGATPAPSSGGATGGWSVVR